MSSNGRKKRKVRKRRPTKLREKSAWYSMCEKCFNMYYMCGRDLYCKADDIPKCSICGDKAIYELYPGLLKIIRG